MRLLTRREICSMAPCVRDYWPIFCFSWKIPSTKSQYFKFLKRKGKFYNACKYAKKHDIAAKRIIDYVESLSYEECQKSIRIVFTEFNLMAWKAKNILNMRLGKRSVKKEIKEANDRFLKVVKARAKAKREATHFK